MDYKDYQAGAQQKSFWFKGKEGLIETLLKKVPQKQNQKILNIGAGTGDDLAIIKKFGNIHAIDIDENAVKLIPDNLVAEKKVGDACNIPYPDNSFDVAVAFDVLEHIKDDQKMVDEIHRVLKPGGHFVFTVPAYNALYSDRDKYLNHHRRYNKKMVKKLFKPFEKQTLGSWFSILFQPAISFLMMPKFIKKRFSSDPSRPNFHNFPKLLDSLFHKVLKTENWLISKGMRFPFGLTVYGIYKKQ